MIITEKKKDISDNLPGHDTYALCVLFYFLD